MLRMQAACVAAEGKGEASDGGRSERISFWRRERCSMLMTAPTNVKALQKDSPPMLWRTG
jgi:hypothetical protein